MFFHRPITRAQTAFTLTLAAALCGILFALADPHLEIWRRVGRITVDISLLLLARAYLRAPQPDQPPVKTIGAHLRKWTGILFTLIAAAFILWTPHVDPWLRAYRLSVTALFLVLIGFDLQNAIDRRALKRALLLQFGVVAFESVLMLYMTWTIDMPLIRAAFAQGVTSVSTQFIRNGMPIPESAGITITRSRAFSDTLTYHNGRLYAKSYLRDTLHQMHDDPGQDLNIRIDFSAQHFMQILSATHDPLRASDAFFQSTAYPDLTDQCTLVYDMHQPLNGYSSTWAESSAIDLAFKCAVLRHDVKLERYVFSVLTRALNRARTSLNTKIANRDCGAASQVYGSTLGLSLSIDTIRSADPQFSQRPETRQIFEPLWYYDNFSKIMRKSCNGRPPSFTPRLT